MSNPNDPKPTNPDDPSADKGDEAGRTGSSYEFNLGDVKSYSDLPPLPQPETPDGSLGQAALPPRPTANRPTQGSFDFIDLDADMAALSDPDVQLPPVPPLLTPTPNAVSLPPVPRAPLLTPTPNAVDLPFPAPAPGPLPTLNAVNIPPVPHAPSTDIVIDLPDVPLLTPTPNAVNIPSLPSQPIVNTVDLPFPPTALPTGTVADVSTLYPKLPTGSSEADLGAAPAKDDSGSFLMSGGTGPAPLPVPSAVPVPSDGTVALPPTIPVAFTMSSADIDLGPDAAPSGEVPVAQAASMPDFDLSSISGTNLGSVPEAVAASMPDFDLESTEQIPALPIPDAEASSNTDIDLSAPGVPPSEIPSGVFATAPDLDLGEPPADPSSQAARTVPIPDALAASMANVDLPDSGAHEQTIPMAFPASVADIDLSDLPEALEPLSGTLNAADLGAMPSTTTDPSSATLNVADLPAPTVKPPSDTLDVAHLARPEPLDTGSGVDLVAELVPAAGADSSVADIGTLQPPTDDAPSSFTMGTEAAAPRPLRMPSEPSFELPPVPLPGTDPSLGSMGSSGSMGSFGSISVPDISILFPAEPPKPAPPFASSDNATADLGLPPLAPDATASSVGLGQLRPVAPSDSWLDSDPALKPTAPLPPAAPAAGPDTSDIFSGHGTASGRAGSVEHSDVIAATAYPADPGAAPPPRPSDIALNFAGPPGGSTVPDLDDMLPLADDELELVSGGPDDESIHGPGPGEEDPLFDSATLADAPDLPAGRADDAPNFGAAPAYSGDASSILGATDPSIDLAGDSSVSVERPGMDGTLRPVEGAFDLTVPEMPVPEGLFDDEPEVPPSGSDLFESRTAADLDLHDLAGRVQPVDPNLVPDQPSLTSDPQSIFSGGKQPKKGSGGSSFQEPTDPDLDEAEFSDHPTPTQGPGVRRSSSGDFELPDATAAHVPPDDGDIDWDVVSENEDATRGMPRDASLSALVREQMEEANDPTGDNAPVGAVAGSTSGPEVSVDWVSGSSEQSPVLDAMPPPPARGKKPTAKPTAKAAKPEPDFAEKPTKTATPAKDKGPKKPAALTDSGTATPSALADDPKKRTRETRSLFTGVLLGGLLAAGATAGTFLALDKPGGGSGPGPGNGTKPPVAVVAGPSDAVALLNSGDAKAALESLKDKKPETAEDKATDGAVRLFARAQALDGKAAADDADLKAARDSLEAAMKAADEAKNEKLAAQAAVRLGAAYQLAGDTDKAREVYTAAKGKYTSFAKYFDALLAKLDAGGAPSAFRRITPAEAERMVLEFTILLAQNPKADAPKPDEPEEAGVAYWQAVKLAKDGKYDEAIKLIDEARAAHIKRAKALAGRGLNPLTDPLEEMFPRACDEMKAGWAARRDYSKSRAELTVAKTELTKANKDLETAKGEATKAKTDAETAKTEYAKAAKEAEVAKADFVKLDKDYKALDKAKGEVEEKLKVADTNLTKAGEDLKAAQADAKARADTLSKVAAELKPVKALPANPKEDELLAVVKSAAGLASGDTAKELLKAQEAAKAAQEKLATETKALTAKYDTDTKKLKDDAAADLKKAKDAGADEVAKVTEKYTIDAKKAEAIFAAALKTEQAKTAAERDNAAAQSIAFQKQLANALPPSAGLDLWLPVLAELRRPSDADPAMALAAKALESSAPGSEDAAKARTTTGMGFFLKGDYANAKTQFQLAVRSPAFKAAKEGKGKYWATVAENGLEAIDDPLALYRRPVVIPPIDLKAAARGLDVGISAYKAGRYDAAIEALTTSAKNDPADPVAWYYLGAARYAKGDTAQADKDIAQGGERERNSSVPGRVVSDALAPIQGRARAAIDKARP